MQEPVTIQSLRGRVFGIQHFSIHDGNGVRTNVFFKGCPLRCLWCHNPEGISREPILSFAPNKCLGCGNCFSLCPQVHKMQDGVHIFHREACVHCWRCVEACPGQALEKVGVEMTVQEVVDDILRDVRYYRASGGGVTLSGGEPMMQFDFAQAILTVCKQNSLNTAMETCGVAPTHQYEQLLPLIDTFLFDIKESDPTRHKAYTGADNVMILQNLAFLCDHPVRVILRCPIIPGLNDRKEHFEYLAALSRRYRGVEGIELMPYHKLGTSKAQHMGLPPQQPFPEPTNGAVEEWNQAIADAGGIVMKY